MIRRRYCTVWWVHGTRQPAPAAAAPRSSYKYTTMLWPPSTLAAYHSHRSCCQVATGCSGWPRQPLPDAMGPARPRTYLDLLNVSVAPTARWLIVDIVVDGEAVDLSGGRIYINARVGRLESTSTFFSDVGRWRIIVTLNTRWRMTIDLCRGNTISQEEPV